MTPPKTVSFSQMAHGSAEDYQLLARYEQAYLRDLPERLLAALGELEKSFGGYQISRLAHSLQSATRAEAGGESEEMIVAALLHDIGDALAPISHSEMAAAILRPFVDERIYWIVKHHGVFQLYYYAHHYGGDRHARDRYRGHRWYQDCADFCEHYDQNCFDPAYPSKPLDYFAPMLRRVFAQPREKFV